MILGGGQFQTWPQGARRGEPAAVHRIFQRLVEQPDVAQIDDGRYGVALIRARPVVHQAVGGTEPEGTARFR